MSKNLHQYFEEQKHLALDNETKAKLYGSINRKIKHVNGFSRLSLAWSKVVSVSLVAMLFFSLFRYGYIPTNVFQKIASVMRPSSTAMADYVGTVISWDGTYQIILDNKKVDTSKTDNRIPVWSQLVLEKWSKLSFRTSNEAQADVVGPAKISFTKNKENNQLILDVQYSENIEIKQQKPVNNNNRNNENQTWSNELLVVKTDNKTIVSKWEWLHIALAHQGEENIITNKEGDIAITTIDSNKTVELKTNQVAVLDAEVRLFATNDDETKKDEQLVIALATKKSSGTTIGTQVNLTETLLGKQTELATGIISVDVQNPDDGSLTSMLIDELRARGSDIVDLGEAVIDNWSLENDDDMYITAKSDTEAYQNIEVNTKTDALLQSKKILSTTMVQLLDDLYVGYYAASNKNASGVYQITTVAPVLMKLCSQLHLSCSNAVTSDDYKAVLRNINTTINTHYIVSAEIKLIK